MVGLKQKQFLARFEALLNEYHIDEITIKDDRISFISNGNHLQFMKYIDGTYTMVRTIDNHGNLEEDDYNE